MSITQKAEYLAAEGLKIGAIKLRPEQPFQWASGYHMPIYNNNRRFLWDKQHRTIVGQAFVELLGNHFEHLHNLDFIAGTTTAGIPFAEIVADMLCKPMCYVRSKPKGHGMQTQVEGPDPEKGLDGLTGVVIEDLISTGGSSAQAVQGARDAKGIVNHCLSIFSYGLDKADEAFAKLNPNVIYESILTYDILMKVAEKTGEFNDNQLAVLKEWEADPWNWGEKHGFPKVEK